nr:aconitate hydratase AcnA [Actinomycetota bacterium]
MSKVNSFSSADDLVVGGKTYRYFKLSSAGGANLPFSLKILLENLLRTEDGANITAAHIEALVNWNPSSEPDTEIQFTPARVIMQDFTGVPCIVDLATMREAVAALGGDPKKINPLAPAEMVIDHSVVIDVAGRADAFEKNVELEYERNGERYQFLRWGQTAFDDFKVVPPGTGIVHQVNIEYLARTVMTREVDGVLQAYPDSCVGTDSHTTMVNGLGILGWGVGGIEAEAAMLGQPVSMLIPKVVGFKLTGKIPTGATATDVVLTITEMLRKHGVVGKFVEFYGAGVGSVPLANRATIGNMSPEFGSTVAIFPIDDVTLDYLRITGRTQEQIDLVEAYTKAQGLWHDPSKEPLFSEYLELDLSTVVPSIAGPKRPQDRIELSQAKQKFHEVLPTYTDKVSNQTDVKGADFDIDNGIVSIASITSCTNTSNPSVMLAAGLLAQKAVAKGLKAKPWVKTSLAPGSKVVTEYYEKAGLTESLNDLGFNLVGYGCTTCIGNSGPLDDSISEAINRNDLAVTAVLSGNRNFEGRINPDVKMNYLASPPLVIAYALAGTMDFDFETQALGQDAQGNDVFLADVWPTPEEVQKTIDESINSDMFKTQYAGVFDGDSRWKSLPTPTGATFEWDEKSTYVRRPPYFEGMKREPSA